MKIIFLGSFPIDFLVLFAHPLNNPNATGTLPILITNAFKFLKKGSAQVSESDNDIQFPRKLTNNILKYFSSEQGTTCGSN